MRLVFCHFDVKNPVRLDLSNLNIHLPVIYFLGGECLGVHKVVLEIF
jgi:hypothetical protein